MTQRIGTAYTHQNGHGAPPCSRKYDMTASTCIEYRHQYHSIRILLFGMDLAFIEPVCRPGYRFLVYNTVL
jgi:hypothetical protein